MCEGVNFQCHFLSCDWHTSVGTYPNRTTHPVTLPEELCQNNWEIVFLNTYCIIMRKHTVTCFLFPHRMFTQSCTQILKKNEREECISNAAALRCTRIMTSELQSRLYMSRLCCIEGPEASKPMGAPAWQYREYTHTHTPLLGHIQISTFTLLMLGVEWVSLYKNV